MVSTKVMEIMLIEHFCNFVFIFPAQFSNAIASEIPGPIDFKFYVRDPGGGSLPKLWNNNNIYWTFIDCDTVKFLVVKFKLASMVYVVY